jgi:hypothetical protein
MIIKWSNIAVFALVVITFIVFIKTYRSIAEFLNSIGRIGPGSQPGDWTSGLVAFGLIGVLVVAIVAILNNGKGN